MAETSNSDTTTTIIAEYNVVKNRIRALYKKRKRIFQLEESLPKGKPLNKDQQELLESNHRVVTLTDMLENLLEDLSSAIKRADDAAPASTCVQTKEPIPHFNEAKNQERYLCVSDGFVIYCLDLKQHEDESKRNCSHNIPPLPKISTLNLAEKGLPILTGLFKLGSNAYIVGGRKFKAMEKDPNQWFMSIFSSFAEVPGLNGTSCVPYRLSLVDGNLSMSECDDIKPLNKLVAWPIVEKIGEEIHVIESFPYKMFKSCDAGMANHEVLNLNDLSSGWTGIKHMYFDYMSHHYGARIFAHLAVGDRIYTRAKCPKKKILSFDSKTRDWEEHRVDAKKCLLYPSEIDHITQLFGIGKGRCVGGFLRGEFRNSLYVVFAMIEDEHSVHAVAYLVAITGEVLCWQPVPHFFEGFVGPASVMDSTIFNVDEEGKTMCVVIDGKPSNDGASECLFVVTFTVEELPDARLWIRDLWRQRLEETSAFERDFVKVVVKDKYVYKTDGQAECRINRMQACFL